MNILIDQNISFRLIGLLHHKFPKITHIKDLGLTNSSDHEIFVYARENDFTAILTLDQDFQNILIRYGPPPKVIWLRVGNSLRPYFPTSS